MSEVSERDKLTVAILLAEYSAMRNQVISRGAGLIQVTSIGVAALALVFVRQGSLFSGIFLFLFLLAIVGMLWRFIWRDIDREAAHVRSLEDRINKIAGGPELLTWELLHGGAKVGYTMGFWDFLPIGVRSRASRIWAATHRIIKRRG